MRLTGTRRMVASAIATGLGLWLVASPAAGAAALRAPLKVGVSLALTGPDARWGVPMLRGVELAVEDVNRAGGLALETAILDAGASAEDTLSRQALVTTHYERLIADPTVVAVVGPQTSGEGRAVAPLLSRAGLATITPSSTTFDITAPAFQDRFRPGGRAVYFRTVGTDLSQGEAMARFAHDRLGIRRLALVDDGTDFGVRTALAFARQADALGMTVLVRKKVAWTEEDYRRELRELGALDPEGLYFAGSYLVGVKVARQVAEIIPSVHRLGTESLCDRAFPLQAGAAAEGWYVPNVAPDVAASPAARAWAERYRTRFGDAPSGYSLAAYTAVTVVADAAGRVVKRGRPVTRASVREAIEATRLPDTPQGRVSFDANGDLERPVVTIYQARSGALRHVGTVTAGRAWPGPGAGARP